MQEADPQDSIVAHFLFYSFAAVPLSAPGTWDSGTDIGGGLKVAAGLSHRLTALGNETARQRKRPAEGGAEQ